MESVLAVDGVAPGKLTRHADPESEDVTSDKLEISEVILCASGRLETREH